MVGQVTSGMAAVMGAFVGALTSLARTWVGERSQSRRDLLQQEIAKRETAYSDFVEQASKMYVEAATHHINDDKAEVEEMTSFFAVWNRMRLFASDPVMREAEKVVDRIIMQYGAENISAEQLRKSALEKKDDPVKPFSIICRRELHDIQRGM